MRPAGPARCAHAPPQLGDVLVLMEEAHPEHDSVTLPGTAGEARAVPCWRRGRTAPTRCCDTALDIIATIFFVADVFMTLWAKGGALPAPWESLIPARRLVRR